MDGTKLAPTGSWDADSVTILAGLALAAVTVKLIHVPVITVWFLGRASVSGVGACTLMVIVAWLFAWGKAESVTVKVTVYDPAVEYACVVELPVPDEPSPNEIVYVYGVVPPVADAVKANVWPT